MNASEVPAGTRLLVVDDEPSVLDVLATSL